MADAQVKHEQVDNQEPDQVASEAPDSAPEVSDETIKEHLHKLLAEADLQTTTEKNLRKQLEEQLGCDLTERKALIRAEVEDWLNNQPEVQPEKKKKRGGGFGSTASVLSPALSAFLGGVDRLPRPQVVSKIWEYIKANELQDPSNKRNIICDDKMKTIFTPPINMFSMNKQLSKHCKRAEDVGEGGFEVDEGDDEQQEEEEEEERPKKKPPAKRKKAKQESEDEDDDDDDSDGGKPKKKKKRVKREGGSGGGGGFTKPVKLSPQLAAFLGAEQLSRGDLTKRFWAYFKENNLMDPTNKQFVLADERLKELLGEDRFQAFGIQRLLAPHIIKDA